MLRSQTLAYLLPVLTDAIARAEKEGKAAAAGGGKGKFGTLQVCRSYLGRFCLVLLEGLGSSFQGQDGKGCFGTQQLSKSALNRFLLVYKIYLGCQVHLLFVFGLLTLIPSIKLKSCLPGPLNPALNPSHTVSHSLTIACDHHVCLTQICIISGPGLFLCRICLQVLFETANHRSRNQSRQMRKVHNECLPLEVYGQ